MDEIAVIILAAGKGTRMKSDLAKVLHKVAGTSMVVHVTRCARALTTENIHLVVGHQADQVKAEVGRYFAVHFAHQRQLLGTGDAVKAALPGLGPGIRQVLVLCGDVPLIRKSTLSRLAQGHREAGSTLSVLAVYKKNPHGYGRIIMDGDGRFAAIREESDANPVEKQITLVNSGIYCFDRGFLEKAIEHVGNDNEQAEYYLTDLAEIAVSQGETVHVQILDDPDQVMGVNTLPELAQAEALFREDTDELP